MKREENTYVKSRVPLWRMLDFFYVDVRSASLAAA